MKIFFKQLESVIKECDEGIHNAKLSIDNPAKDGEIRIISRGQLQGYIKIKKFCYKKIGQIKNKRFTKNI